MGAYDLGEIAERTVEIHDADTGALTDADTAPTWTVTLPDGTAGTSPAVTRTGVGAYRVLYPTTAAGMHADTWTATVAGIVVKFGPNAFRVRAGQIPILDLADARAALGVGVDAIRDEQIRQDLEAATQFVERQTGRRWRRWVVTGEEHHVTCQSAIILHQAPVLSVETVTMGGAVVAPTAWTLTKGAAILHGSWSGAITVDYTAGVTDPPGDVLDAVRLKLQMIAATRRGAAGAPRRGVNGADPLAIELDRVMRGLPSLPGFA